MMTISAEPLDESALREAVLHSGAGALVMFHGVTRDNANGRGVIRLEYQAHESMALTQMAEIRDQIRKRWPTVRVAMAHRVGEVAVGQTSVIIAVSAPHREAAYRANRFAIDALKRLVPIWKKEWYSDGGTNWKANS